MAVVIADLLQSGVLPDQLDEVVDFAVLLSGHVQLVSPRHDDGFVRRIASGELLLPARVFIDAQKIVVGKMRDYRNGKLKASAPSADGLPPSVLSKADGFVRSLQFSKSPMTPMLRSNELGDEIVRTNADMAAVARLLRERLKAAGLREADIEARVGGLVDDVALARAVLQERRAAAGRGPR